ncbi:hypothetical protein TcarDRAFT_1555 [Thermosinus carboxydivorans Nor1]|uniref:Type 4 fimbrial biogenesis protein PilX N-terminal domain-containing protein n=1 Tax=Thermosinus carboxydivorans Nor1 TaxID=401526 RepID=A1HQ16_9FIRM|nr:pilus assembly PilX N-terminal domain-containing protein [Thermosinus carboxydivorans]EAX47866.1 hypothetical protein TcarDRAFT_1555 [Thermosinus carboxydivorans Nor1]
MRTQLRRYLKGQKGSAAILAIVVMLILAVLGAAYVGLGMTETSTAANFRDGIAAQYLAEAGVKRALIELYNNSAWDPGAGGLTEKQGNGSFTVIVRPGETSSQKKVVSTGQVNRARRQVVLDVNLPSNSGNGSVYDYSVFAGSNMVVHNKARVIGAIHSNNGMELKNGSYISGKVEVHGAFTDHGATLGTPPAITNAPEIPFPAFNAADYKQGAQVLPWGRTLSAGNYRGKYYYMGSQLTIDSGWGSIQGDATIFATGDIDIKNGTVIGGDSSAFLIIALGNIDVNNGSILKNVVLISAGGNINLHSDVELTGSAIAKEEIIVHGGGSKATTVTYNKTLMGHFNFPVTGDAQFFQVISYKPFQVKE